MEALVRGMAEQAVRLLTLLAYDVALRANSRLAAAEGLSGAYSPHGRALRGPFLLYCNFFCGESFSLIQKRLILHYSGEIMNFRL